MICWCEWQNYFGTNLSVFADKRRTIWKWSKENPKEIYLNWLGTRQRPHTLRNVMHTRVKAQAAQQTLLVRQKRLLFHLLGRSPVHRVMQLVGRNRAAAFGDRTGTLGGPEAGVSNIFAFGENHVFPERVFVRGSSLRGTSEEEKISNPPFSGEGNGRQEWQFRVACRGRNGFLLGVAHNVGDSQRRQGPTTSSATRHRNSFPPSHFLLLLLFFFFFFFFFFPVLVLARRCHGRRGGKGRREGTDLSGVEEFVGGERRSVDVSGEIELEIIVVGIRLGLLLLLFPEEGNRGGMRVVEEEGSRTRGAGGGAEEEVGVVTKALGAGRSGDEWGGAVAVEVEVHRNHHFHFHLFSLSFFLLMWNRSASVENQCLFWWDHWIYSEKKGTRLWLWVRERKERGSGGKYWLCEKTVRVVWKKPSLVCICKSTHCSFWHLLLFFRVLHSLLRRGPLDYVVFEARALFFFLLIWELRGWVKGKRICSGMNFWLIFIVEVWICRVVSYFSLL